MDISRIVKTVESFNKHITNSFVRKSSLMTQKSAELAKLINNGKMIYDSSNGIEKPDVHWVQALKELIQIQKSQGNEIIEFYLEELHRETKPNKFTLFLKLLDSALDIQAEIKDKTASNITNLLSVAEYIEKSADNMSKKIHLARLIDSHIEYIINLLNKNPGKAREYIEAIKPQKWELGRESTEDKIYENVVRGLSERLDPEQYQSLGL